MAPALRVTTAVIEADDGDGGWRVIAPLPAAQSARVDLGAVGAGIDTRVRLTLEAVAPIFGAHLRGWLGESWDAASGDARDESRADVFAVDAWTFDGARAEDTEGWSGCGGAVRVDPGFGALVVDACAQSPSWARLDADGLRLELRAATPDLTVAWPGGERTVALRGDGALEVVTLDLADAAGWERPVTSVTLRAAAPFALDVIEAVDPIDDMPAPPPEVPPPPADGSDAGPPPSPTSDAAPRPIRPDADAPPAPRLDAGPPGLDGGAPGAASPEHATAATLDGGCRTAPMLPQGALLGLLLLLPALRRRAPPTRP